MNLGKKLFLQLFEFVPWASFTHIVAQSSCNSRVRTLSCTEQFRAMTFAQLTYARPARHRSLLAVQSGKAVLDGLSRDSSYDFVII